MAVMVIGMEMPRCCNDCRFAVWREAVGRAYDYIVQCQALPEGDDDEIDAHGEDRWKRLDNCPLEEVN